VGFCKATEAHRFDVVREECVALAEGLDRANALALALFGVEESLLQQRDLVLKTAYTDQA